MGPSIASSNPHSKIKFTFDVLVPGNICSELGMLPVRIKCGLLVVLLALTYAAIWMTIEINSTWDCMEDYNTLIETVSECATAVSELTWPQTPYAIREFAATWQEQLVVPSCGSESGVSNLLWWATRFQLGNDVMDEVSIKDSEVFIKLLNATQTITEIESNWNDLYSFAKAMHTAAVWADWLTFAFVLLCTAQVCMGARKIIYEMREQRAQSWNCDPEEIPPYYTTYYISASAVYTLAGWLTTAILFFALFFTWVWNPAYEAIWVSSLWPYTVAYIVTYAWSVTALCNAQPV